MPRLSWLIILTTHDILKHRDAGKQIDVTVLDFSKAFDTVPIRRLQGKLEFYGVNGSTLKWIESFLTGRTQSVGLLCDGERSDSEKVLSGVPYSSCYILMGYLLSLILIHDADYLQMTAYSTELLTISKTNYSCRRT